MKCFIASLIKDRKEQKIEIKSILPFRDFRGGAGNTENFSSSWS